MKYLLFIFLTLICLTSCRQKQRRPYNSVLETNNSLINQWYGKDHFKENYELEDQNLNKNEDQTSFESDAGEMVVNSTSSSSSSSSDDGSASAQPQSSASPSTSNSSAAPSSGNASSPTSSSTSQLDDQELVDIPDEKQLSAEETETPQEDLLEDQLLEADVE